MRIHEITIVASITALLCVGCASWHEPVSDFADQWGDKLGLDIEPPADVPQAEITEDEPVIVPAPEPQVDAPVASETPQDGPKLPAKAYPGSITVNGLEWTLTGDPGGWDYVAGYTWDGAHWGGCTASDVVGRNASEGKAKIRWNGYGDPMSCACIVWIQNVNGRPKNIWAMWPSEVLQ